MNNKGCVRKGGRVLLGGSSEQLGCRSVNTEVGLSLGETGALDKWAGGLIW